MLVKKINIRIMKDLKQESITMSVFNIIILLLIFIIIYLYFFLFNYYFFDFRFLQKKKKLKISLLYAKKITLNSIITYL